MRQPSWCKNTSSKAGAEILHIKAGENTTANVVQKYYKPGGGRNTTPLRGGRRYKTSDEPLGAPTSASGISLKVCGASDKHVGDPTGAAGARLRSLRSHKPMGAPTNASGVSFKAYGAFDKPWCKNALSKAGAEILYP